MDMRFRFFVKPGLIIWVLFLMTAALGASEYAVFNVRLYESVKGQGKPMSPVVTTSYIEPFFVGDRVSESDLQQEQDKLKQVFNVNEVRLLLQTRLIYRYKPNAKLFRVFSKNGDQIGVLVSKEKGTDTYRIKVNEGTDYKDKDKNLLDTEAVLPVKNTVIFGFKDLKGGTYFMAFHREVDIREFKQSEQDRVLISTQYQPRLEHYVPPVYPEEAIKVKVQGNVMLKVEIDSAGEVVKAEIVHGHPLLRLAALEAIKHSKYKPVDLEAKEKSSHLSFHAVVSFHLPETGEKAEAFGEIIGTVTRQEDGSVIPGVSVEAVNETTKIKRTTKTDQNGFYGFMGLPEGPYMLTFKHEDYVTVAIKSYQKGGKTYKVNVYLKKKK